jgi:hypothetical protein
MLLNRFWGVDGSANAAGAGDAGLADSLWIGKGTGAALAMGAGAWPWCLAVVHGA